MNKQVKILRGIPGAGKSTFIKTMFPEALIVSADFFFIQDGEYKFNPLKLGEAHSQCLRDFNVALLEAKANIIVVDNTNIYVVDIAPYAALAVAYGYDLEILNLNVDPKVATERCVHGVSAESVKHMSDMMKQEVQYFPPRWRVRNFKQE